MGQPRLDRVLTIASFLVGVGACATMTPPAANSGPAASSTGVQVAVLRQRCAESRLGTMEQWVDETIEVQVRNGSAGPVSIHRDRFRLLAPDGSAFGSGDNPADPVAVGQGGAQTFELTFSARNRECTQGMQLDPATAIIAGEGAVVLRSVAFVPSRAL